MSEASFDHWAFFANAAQRMDAPLYATLARAIVDDDALRALAGKHRPGQPPPNLLFAAVHYLLLRGADHPLRAFYATLNGGIAGSGDPLPAFRDFCKIYRDEILALVATRVTNTNEVGRTAILHAGFRELAKHAQAPFHLIEIGPSAGLNMIWDHYGARYVKDGKTVAAVNSDAPLVVTCELRGDHVPPVDPAPTIASRVGLELHPVDLCEPDARDWLKALVWPDHPARFAQLEKALAIVRDYPLNIIPGDALENLIDALRAVPPDQTVCVYHTIAIYQFSTAMKAALDDILMVAGLRRPVWRLSMEELRGHGGEVHLTRYSDGVTDETLIGRCHSHGAWLEWLG